MRLRDRITALVGRDNLEFLTHARNYLSGEVIVGIIGFASIPVLTRLLSPGEYGVLALFLSVVGIIALLLEMNFRGAVNRYWLDRTDDFTDFLATNLAFLAGITVINLAWMWFARAPLARFFRIPPDVFYLAVLCAALRLPWNLNWKLLVAQQRSVRYATLRAVREVLVFGIGVAWVYVLSRERHLGMIYTTLLVSAGFGLGLSIWLIGQARGGRLRWKHLRYALWFGIPLMPHALSGFILAFFDRVIVAQIEGDVSTGLYSVAYDIGSVMNVVVVAMNQSWLPIFVENRRNDRFETIERLAATYAKYIYFVAMVLVLFAQEIVMLLADQGFHEALPLVPIIIYAYVGVFLYTLYSHYSFYLRKTWWISLATVIAGAVNIGLNYWSIPIWGYVAAAWTTLASYLLLFVLHFCISRFILREPVIRLGAVLPWLFVSGAVSVGFSIAQSLIDHYWITLLAVKLPLLGLVVWLAIKARFSASQGGDR